MSWPLATWDGLEVDMLSLGDADSILVTRWTRGQPISVLIDGGNKTNAVTVKTFLASRGIAYIDHVVCTHPHNDHASGLVELISNENFSFGKFWMHLPWQHAEIQTIRNAIKRTSARRVAKIIEESLETSWSLANAVWSRNKPVFEPFAGHSVGFLRVCGPSQQFYRNLVSDFGDLGRLQTFESDIEAHERRLRLEWFDELIHNRCPDGILGAEPTEPENDSSVILAAQYGYNVFVFTGDAGVPALTNAAQAYPWLAGCRWMQIPHHGSRRNVNQALINFFRPTVAFVSAAGNTKHPRRRVVNAFENAGSVVYSTHYPRSASLYYHVGFVPSRTDYGPAVSLYN